jgi:2-keto-4-pentenoate hydratase
MADKGGATTGDEARIAEAANVLWANWRGGSQFDGLPPECRPQSREEGYAVQRQIAKRSGDAMVGWKIAATSTAGQRHIAASGPLAGRLHSRRVHFGNATFSLRGNIMRVAEAEFAFRIGRDLPRAGGGLSVKDVMDAVTSAHPAIELPDSRYADFVKAGEPQLVADTACAGVLAIGPPFPAVWRDIDLVEHGVNVRKDGRVVATGTGRAVLGDPRVALAWLANEVDRYADGLKEGDYVTTGTCVVPVPIGPGETIVADYGRLGRLRVQLI